jgi:hypothetical protein
VVMVGFNLNPNAEQSRNMMFSIAK